MEPLTGRQNMYDDGIDALVCTPGEQARGFGLIEVEASSGSGGQRKSGRSSAPHTTPRPARARGRCPRCHLRSRTRHAWDPHGRGQGYSHWCNRCRKQCREEETLRWLVWNKAEPARKKVERVNFFAAGGELCGSCWSACQERVSDFEGYHGEGRFVLGSDMNRSCVVCRRPAIPEPSAGADIFDIFGFLESVISIAYLGDFTNGTGPLSWHDNWPKPKVGWSGKRR